MFFGRLVRPKKTMLRPFFLALTLLALLSVGAAAQPDPALPRVTVGTPVSRAPFPGEIHPSLHTGAVRGALVYAGDRPLGTSDKAGKFLAFCSNVASIGDAAKVVVYPLEMAGDDVPFDPQFSPDGQSVLFKVGALDGPYHLFCLDLPTGAVRLAVKRALTLRRVIFSPDGQYLAYVAGQIGEQAQPLRLLCNEWKKDREKLIVRNDGTFNGFAWSAPHTLYFTALPTAPKANPSTDRKGEIAALSGVVNQKVPTVARPNIYVAAPESGQIQLAMLEGNRPQPSPDGKWVAFFGMETPANPSALRPEWQLKPSYVALSVMRAEGLGRMALNEEGQSYPQVFWMNDNRHLVAASFTPTTPPDRRQEVSRPVFESYLHIVCYDTEDGRISGDANVMARALSLNPNAEGNFPVRALQMTRDGKSLFIAAQSAPQDWHFTPESELPGGGTVLAVKDVMSSNPPKILAKIPRSTGVDFWQPPHAP